MSVFLLNKILCISYNNYYLLKQNIFVWFLRKSQKRKKKHSVKHISLNIFISFWMHTRKIIFSSFNFANSAPCIGFFIVPNSNICLIFFWFVNTVSLPQYVYLILLTFYTAILNFFYVLLVIYLFDCGL